MSSSALSPRGADARVISLVGVAHGLSHFYQLVVPVLFLMIKDEWQVSFSALALTATVFYMTSGFAQTIAGFAVDRFGARRVLECGLGLLAGAMVLTGLAPNYGFLLLCSAIAGIGNSVFHPADFGILNAAVDPKRLGPAYSVHSIAGNIGWALAPVTTLALAGLFGWRGALIISGLAGFGVLGLLIANRNVLSRGAEAERAAVRAAGGGFAAMTTPAVLACFVFFTLLAAGIIGIQNFGISTLNTRFGLTPAWASALLTSYLIGGAVGILAGGWLATRVTQHALVAALGMSAAACAIGVIGFGILPPWGIAVALTLAGVFSGLTNPSRDLLIRAVCARGHTGKVYGFVYSGLDAGSAMAPLLFGWLLDAQLGSWVMFSIALLWLSTLWSVYAVRHAAAPPQP